MSYSDVRQRIAALFIALMILLLWHGQADNGLIGTPATPDPNATPGQGATDISFPSFFLQAGLPATSSDVDGITVPPPPFGAPFFDNPSALAGGAGAPNPFLDFTTLAGMTGTTGGMFGRMDRSGEGKGG